MQGYGAFPLVEAPPPHSNETLMPASDTIQYVGLGHPISIRLTKHTPENTFISSSLIYNTMHCPNPRYRSSAFTIPHQAFREATYILISQKAKAKLPILIRNLP